MRQKKPGRSLMMTTPKAPYSPTCWSHAFPQGTTTPQACSLRGSRTTERDSPDKPTTCPKPLNLQNLLKFMGVVRGYVGPVELQGLLCLSRTALFMLPTYTYIYIYLPMNPSPPRPPPKQDNNKATNEAPAAATPARFRMPGAYEGPRTLGSRVSGCGG